MESECGAPSVCVARVILDLIPTVCVVAVREGIPSVVCVATVALHRLVCVSTVALYRDVCVGLSSTTTIAVGASPVGRSACVAALTHVAGSQRSSVQSSVGS